MLSYILRQVRNLQMGYKFFCSIMQPVLVQKSSNLAGNCFTLFFLILTFKMFFNSKPFQVLLFPFANIACKKDRLDCNAKKKFTILLNISQSRSCGAGFGKFGHVTRKRCQSSIVFVLPLFRNYCCANYASENSSREFKIPK